MSRWFRLLQADRVADRPYTLLSCCVSLDGYLSGAGARRLLLSNEADFDRVDGLRADCDAILVGAATVRADNPRLLVRDPDRRARRRAAGRPESPVKVTVTARGRLDPRAAFFTASTPESGGRLVYCPSAAASGLREALHDVAEVVDGGAEVDMYWLSRDLHRRGVQRLMVEGGGRVHTQFLTADLADELQLTVAPFFVGDARARRFVADGKFPFSANRRATLAEVRPIGDVALLRYALSDRFPLDFEPAAVTREPAPPMWSEAAGRRGMAAFPGCAPS